MILGDSPAAWMTAAYLSRLVSGRIELVLVRHNKKSKEKSLITSTPRMRALIEFLGIDEKDFVKKTGAGFNLANEYKFWSSETDSFFYSFGDYGFKDLADFNQIAVRLKRMKVLAEYDRYSIGAMAARKNRFFISESMKVPFDMQFNFGFQMEKELFCQYMESYAMAGGLVVHNQVASNVERQTETGSLAALVLESGEKIQADFFIDASGGESFIFSEMAESRMQTWRPYFLFDRVSSIFFRGKKHKPYVKLSIFGDTVLKETYSRFFCQRQLYYNSARLSDSQGLDRLGMDTDERNSEEKAFRTTINPGIRQGIWQGNVLAVGKAAVDFEDWLASELDLTYLLLDTFRGLFPVDFSSGVLAKEYNKNVVEKLNSCRDFHLAQYWVARQSGRPELKRAFASVSRPKSLDCRINLYLQKGKIPRFENEYATRQEWANFFAGMNRWPGHCDVTVAMNSPERMHQYNFAILDAVEKTVKEMPMLQDFFDTYCPILNSMEAHSEKNERSARV